MVRARQGKLAESVEEVQARNLTVYKLCVEPAVSLALGLIPGAFWLWYLRRQDDHEPEPWRLVLLVFLLGGFSTFAVLAIRPCFEDLLPLGTGPDRTVADAFLLTAPLEELLKLAALFLGIFWSRELDEPLDGIVYGTAVGLGFASFENIHYIARESSLVEQGQLTVLRGFTATLVHTSASGSLGYFLGLTRFSERSRRPWLVAVGVLLAVSFHGTYDAFLANRALHWIALLLVLPAMLFLLGVKLRWARGQSESYHPGRRR